jgi:DNA-binding NtrC family response regulator
MEDLPLLVSHFLAMQPQPRTLDDIPPHIWALFQSYRWPGNVRELKNAVQRLLILPDRPLPQFQDGERQVVTEDRKVPAAEDERLLPLREARREAADVFEQDYLRRVLERTQNNVTRAAAIAEVSRQMVQRLMRKHGL